MTGIVPSAILGVGTTLSFVDAFDLALKAWNVCSASRPRWIVSRQFSFSAAPSLALQ
jgi:hypothetical protein